MPKAAGAWRLYRKQVGEERGELPGWLVGCRSKTGLKEGAAGGEKKVVVVGGQDSRLERRRTRTRTGDSASTDRNNCPMCGGKRPKQRAPPRSSTVVSTMELNIFFSTVSSAMELDRVLHYVL